MNISMFTGRVCQDMELKTVGSGTVCNFSIAVQSMQKGTDGKYLSDFFNCSVWNKRAEYAVNHIHKGDKVFVQGTLSNKSWTDKNGSKHTQTMLMVNNIELMSGARDRETTPAPSAGDVFTAFEDDTALPFDL